MGILSIMGLVQSVILPSLTEFKIPALFLGAFFFGETVILSAVFFALESGWSLFEVFSVSLFGITLADLAWFLAGRYFLSRSARFQRLKEKHKDFLEKFGHQSRKRQLLYLVFFKFFYGTRIITIFYVATHKMSLRRFLVLDIIGTVLWLLVLMAIGWAAWSGASRALDTFHSLGYILGTIAFLVILLKLVTKWLSKRYTEKL